MDRQELLKMLEFLKTKEERLLPYLMENDEYTPISSFFIPAMDDARLANFIEQQATDMEFQQDVTIARLTEEGKYLESQNEFLRNQISRLKAKNLSLKDEKENLLKTLEQEESEG